MTDRYRKKPVEVRAWKISFDGQEPDWVREAFDGERIDWCPAGEGLYINTLEGHMKAGIGDMLIEGVMGELYGCRADIFAAVYEPVETALAASHLPAGWRIEAHEDEARSWIVIAGPSGQAAAFSAERGSVRAQVLQDFIAAKEQEQKQ